MEAPDIEGLDALLKDGYFLIVGRINEICSMKLEAKWKGYRFMNERRWNFYVFYYCF